MLYVLFILGFVLLIKGADYLIDGSSSLAKKMGISPLIIGLTIVAFGTSMPEMVVNVISALKGNTDVALGNVIGSNIVNILLILGLTAAIVPLSVKFSTVWKEIPYSLLAAVVLLLLCNDVLIDRARESVLTRSDGIILLLFFAGFLYYVFKMAFKSIKDNEAKPEEIGKTRSIPICLLMIAGGLTGLIFGGKWVVDGAIAIATKFGVSQFLISVTIVSLGTSLPELVTCIMAAYKKEYDISIGNVVGSNIFNIFFVLGTTVVIRPITLPPGLNADIGFLIIATLLLFKFMFLGRSKHVLDRWEGVFFLFLYILYLIYLVLRG
jgi:cation:H+ antiporter